MQKQSDIMKYVLYDLHYTKEIPSKQSNKVKLVLIDNQCSNTI